MTELVDKQLDSFNQNLYTLETFIALSKVLGTVNHTILLKELYRYSTENKSLK